MRRLVFELADAVGPDDTRYTALSLKEPPLYPSVAHPFRCSGEEHALIALSNGELLPEAVKNAGRYLFDSVALHPDVGQQLKVALEVEQPERRPVYVRIAAASNIEALPWESLCSPAGDFLGLDERWAVSRMVAGRGVETTSWSFVPPLRIAAILSCLDVPARPEWIALREALAASPDLTVQLLVIVSEEALFDEIRQAIVEGVVTSTEVVLLPQDLDELQERVQAFRPQVLHFFCHGSTEGGPHVELAVKTDWDVGFAQKSLIVEPSQIRDFTSRTETPWLAVMNCCDSAVPGGPEHLQSLALNLVYDGGIPAVVGVREPVASDDASLFTGAFYTSLGRDLAARMGAGEAAAEPVDWARFVVDARKRIAYEHSGRHTLKMAASSMKEWTLPVIYVQPQPFILLSSDAEAAPPVAPETARLEVTLLEGLLAKLPPDTPVDLLTDIDGRLQLLRNEFGQ